MWKERGQQMLKFIASTTEAILIPEGFVETKRQFAALKEKGDNASDGDFQALFAAYARERAAEVPEVRPDEIPAAIQVDHSQIYGTVRAFEHADPWKVIEWLGKNRPKPESDGVMDDNIFVSFPDGRVITGTAINRWIYDMIYGDMAKASK